MDLFLNSFVGLQILAKADELFAARAARGEDEDREDDGVEARTTDDVGATDAGNEAPGAGGDAECSEV